MLAAYHSKWRADISALTSHLRTEHIAHYDKLDHDKLAKIALLMSRVARAEAARRRHEGGFVSPLGLSTAFSVSRNYLLVLMTASAISKARALVGPKAPLYVAELGAGTGINCLTAALCDENTHIYAFDKNPALLQLVRRVCKHFGKADQVTTVEDDFLKHDMSRYPRFNVVVNENIHMGSFKEPLFEAAVAIKPFVAQGAIMIPEGFSAEIAECYFGPRTQVAQINLLNLPHELEFWSATNLKPSDKINHLFFEMTCTGRNVFRTRNEGERSVNLGDLILGTLIRVWDGSQSFPDDEIKDGRIHSYEGRVTVPLTPRADASTLFKILLRTQVEYEGRIPGYSAPYRLYSWNKSLIDSP